MEETIEYRGYQIEVIQDNDVCESPRDWDNLGTMVCFHRGYNLGDKHSFDDSYDFIEFAKEEKPIMLPLYLYDHSGITMRTSSFSCPWDSGQVGMIYVDKDKVKKEWGWKRLTQARREKIYKILEQEVETYDDFLTGNVWGYNVEFEDDSDSCWGFFGDTDYMITEAKSAIDYHIEQKRKRHQEKVKTLISNQVPLFKREELLA